MQARVALADVVELLEAGEAKACYGLAINWKPLEALVEALIKYGVLQGTEVRYKSARAASWGGILLQIKYDWL